MLTRDSGWLFAVTTSTLLAAWPHWLWLAKRVNDGSDEPWGIAALVTFTLLLMRDKKELHQPGNTTLIVSALLMLTANISWGGIPPIFATAFALLGLTFLLTGLLPTKRMRLPLLTLALLTLPLTASLNFYLGYPLRWLCAQAAAPMLSLLGLTVTPQGAALLWNGKSVLIDAPCAGIAMLWLGFYLAAVFSYLNSAGWRRCLINLTLASIVVILANIVRNTLLFYKESGIVQLPNWTHEGIGLLVFGLIVLSIYKLTACWTPSGENHGR